MTRLQEDSSNPVTALPIHASSLSFPLSLIFRQDVSVLMFCWQLWKRSSMLKHLSLISKPRLERKVWNAAKLFTSIHHLLQVGLFPHCNTLQLFWWVDYKTKSNQFFLSLFIFWIFWDNEHNLPRQMYKKHTRNNLRFYLKRLNIMN